MTILSFKQVPLTVVLKNENSVVVKADGVNYRRNVIYVQKYLLREDVVATAASSDR